MFTLIINEKLSHMQQSEHRLQSSFLFLINWVRIVDNECAYSSFETSMTSPLKITCCKVP